MTDSYPELAPFEVDTWPTCQPWERAGQVTPADRRAIATWARTAQRRLRLDIDARFDRVLGRMYATAWPGVVWDDTIGGVTMERPEQPATPAEPEPAEPDDDDDDDDAQPAGA